MTWKNRRMKGTRQNRSKMPYFETDSEDDSESDGEDANFISIGNIDLDEIYDMSKREGDVLISLMLMKNGKFIRCDEGHSQREKQWLKYAGLNPDNPDKWIDFAQKEEICTVTIFRNEVGIETFGPLTPLQSSIVEELKGAFEVTIYKRNKAIKR